MPTTAYHSRFVSSATAVPTPIGVAIARSGDVKRGCGRAKDQGMVKVRMDLEGLVVGARAVKIEAVGGIPPSLRHLPWRRHFPSLRGSGMLHSIKASLFPWELTMNPSSRFGNALLPLRDSFSFERHVV